MIFVVFLTAAITTTIRLDAYAQTNITYIARKGDTLALLAAEYYGDRRHAVFIMAANNIQQMKPLRSRQRLRIPVGPTITVNLGDTLTGLAERHLGDKRRAAFLAEFNGLDAYDSLPVGEEINIPFHVTHRITSNETLRTVAKRYLGSAKEAKTLQQYNFLETLKPKRGDTIFIPVKHVRVRNSRLPAPDPESKSRRAKRREMRKEAKRLLPDALTAWRSGDFATIKRDLTKLDIDYLNAQRAAAVGILLGGAYIAFGDNDSALALFRRVLERVPKYSLSTYNYSPKIRTVWVQAGGTTSP